MQSCTATTDNTIGGAEEQNINVTSLFLQHIWPINLVLTWRHSFALSIGYNLISTCAGWCDRLSRRKCTCWLGDNCKLYLTISRHQLEIWWWQIEFTCDALAEPVNWYLRPWNRQMMTWNFQMQYSYLHSNVIMCIYVYCHIIDKMT